MKMMSNGNDDYMPIFSIEDDYTDNPDQFVGTLPLIALKNTVLFPNGVIPTNVGRQKSIQAVRQADNGNKMVVVITQKDPKVEEPTQQDLYEIGVVAKVVKLLTMPDGTTTAILQGRKKVKIIQFIDEPDSFKANIEVIDDPTTIDSKEFKAIISSIKEASKKIIELSPNIPKEASFMLENMKNDHFLLNFIASNMNGDANTKQEILELNDLYAKAEAIFKQLNEELNLLELKNQIESKVKTDIEKQQRDYFLNQQMQKIQEELGGSPQEEEIKRLETKAKGIEWPEEVEKKFKKELEKLKRINPQVAEYSVTINYLDLFTDLPWHSYSQDNFDLDNVKKTLDKDHYGLFDVKERIIEHLAVLKLRGDLKAPILCLVGPPGVGKTSLGKSIANAINRKFIRMSLGGLHDESELRGHRKTYIGAMPGRVIKSIKKAESSNPVFILDEIDKLGRDHRGDPSSALLEILDPEQNSAFYDNYLETEYDLSKVMFIATANSLNSIQPALLDRMEIIQISGYSAEEKVEIAKKHLVPNQRKEHGLKSSDVTLTPTILSKIIKEYTRESGVRSLNRKIAAVMRYVAKQIATNTHYEIKLSPEVIDDILGPQKYNLEKDVKITQPGVAIGLAWTRVGGDVLFIECSTSKGKGKLTLTGNLGNVMKESANAALSYLKSNASQLGIETGYFDQHDIHIHVPEGATPKDGPSAGITMVTALASGILNKKIKQKLAMSGEMTLRGKVLPVGGINEKVLAAKRAGIRDIILCKDNKPHVEEINTAYLKGVNFHFVDHISEVLDIAIK